MQKSREELQMPLKLLVLYNMPLLKVFTCLLRLSGLYIGPLTYQFCYMVVSVGHRCVGS